MTVRVERAACFRRIRSTAAAGLTWIRRRNASKNESIVVEYFMIDEFHFEMTFLKELAA